MTHRDEAIGLLTAELFGDISSLPEYQISSLHHHATAILDRLAPLIAGDAQDEIAFLRKCRTEEKAKLMKRKAEVTALQAGCRRWRAQADGANRKLVKIQREGLRSSEYDDMRRKIENQRVEINALIRALAKEGGK